ncbi:hypothetical protein TraAM80_04408 [Trypanosoma rangeli]|uniref:Uncharacterized protein n=1 Tax=Trypanosoma rangeli TaxID=5698 RepID=A0A422NJP2_TRYRA|nr:uncharacterized protein TraAM80_04408 [Trypanosoma rangeli]RNF05686.1 hypothetical protein TraAM80_04408 [Trypanosoma rangeli]|eukprot:RNF05686.1 hypothetical protein TraAM80_04408 [Trypanosoma rangeli]
MVRIVPDDYFPTEGDERHTEPSKGTMLTSSNVRSPVWFSSGLYTHFIEFGAPMDEAIRAAIDNVTSLVLADKMEEAIRVVEDAGLCFDLVAVNGTLLAMGANVLLSVLAKPMQLLFLEIVHGGRAGDLMMAFQRALFEGATTAGASGVQEICPDSTDKSQPLMTRFWVGLFSLDAVWSHYAEVTMILVCLALCLLIWLVRLQFAKYFNSLELQLTQQTNGAARFQRFNSTNLRRETATVFPFTREGNLDADALLPAIHYLDEGGDAPHFSDSGSPPPLSGAM